MSNIEIGGVRLSEQNDTVDYLWNIDNKYYTSQVMLCTMENIPVSLPMEGVDALIMYHDPQAVRHINCTGKFSNEVDMF